MRNWKRCKFEMQAGYSYPTKIFDASIVSEKPLLENVGFENQTYGKKL
uniref:Uncharacterized protein n=1 Tax=Neisseria meningitidis alpha522 TaxID=996307 RepID=I4E380_NEIME|nr:hypothetical protein NMALPHA522_0253 [Neisseria meningitidis alpha522]